MEMAYLASYHLNWPTNASLAATGILTPLEVENDSGFISTGYSLQNFSIYVLNAELKPVPVGVQGEIYIEGAGVGSGYLIQPELTRIRFVIGVVSKPNYQVSGRNTMHPSGDLGRWSEDGNLLTNGRIDTQVE